MQLTHRLREILHLWQDVVLEGGRVPDEGVGGGDALDRRVEPREALIGDPGSDLGAVAPGEGVFVRDDHLVRLPDRRLDRFQDRKSTRLNSSHPSISYAV